jgi:hypothetical protein
LRVLILIGSPSPYGIASTSRVGRAAPSPYCNKRRGSGCRRSTGFRWLGFAECLQIARARILHAILSISKANAMRGFSNAPERIRTSGLWFRRPTLYPTELPAHAGGEGGIRTLERSIRSFTRLAGERLQPLGHFSVRRRGPAASASGYFSRGGWNCAQLVCALSFMSNYVVALSMTNLLERRLTRHDGCVSDLQLNR